MPTWCNATITKKKIWTDGLFTITIKADNVKPFEAGQFLQLGVYPEGQQGVEDAIINRPYSVASPHGGELEFFIVLVPEGELTPKLWALEVGDPLLVNDAGVGRFTLDRTPSAKHLWLFATGTGLAPYVAMLRPPKSQRVGEQYEKIVVCPCEVAFPRCWPVGNWKRQPTANFPKRNRRFAATRQCSIQWKSYSTVGGW